MISLFIISVTFALIPIKFSFFRTNIKLIGIANSFSAGIFISVGLVHLLPESTEKLNNCTKSTFPFSFFIARQISEYLHSFKDNETDKNEENFKNLFSKNGKLTKCIGNNSGKRSEDTLLDHPFDNQPISSVNYNSDTIIDHHSITSYILVIALSVHSIFEGIALGLQRTSIRLFYLFLAILSHKWVEALTIGINFNNSQLEYETVKFILLFASMTPIGIILGIIFAGTSDLIEGFFFAVSSGTFLYISASEVVIEEFSLSKYKKHKFLSFIIGAGLIFIVTIFENSQEE